MRCWEQTVLCDLRVQSKELTSVELAVAPVLEEAHVKREACCISGGRLSDPLQGSCQLAPKSQTAALVLPAHFEVLLTAQTHSPTRTLNCLQYAQWTY